MNGFGDVVVVTFKPHPTGSDDVTYDGVFSEGVDSTDPESYDNATVETTKSSVTISGHLVTDLYGMSISDREAIQQLPIGTIQAGDAVFSCLASHALVDSTDRSKGFIFDKCKHVTVSGYYRYVVRAVTTRGFGGEFVVDVWLSKNI